MIPCPSREDLVRLLEGDEDLQGAKFQAVERHMEHCAPCRELFDQLLQENDVEVSRFLKKDAAHSTPIPKLNDTANNVKLHRSTDQIVFPEAPTAQGPLGKLATFHIQRELGRGGMGVVYLARDEKLDRPVAVKVLLPSLASDPRQKSRFVQEGRFAASLNHDHIVKVYDVSEATDQFPLPYLVMEHIDGESLRGRLRQLKILAPEEAARIVRDAALALHAAHTCKLIHRDVKTANIMLQGESSRVKLTDFGLARTTEIDDQRLTQQGEVVGTVEYMSPEHIQFPENVDARSDVYGLGVVLYELLTGELPFSGRLPAKVLQDIVHIDPCPLRQINRQIPRDLETICLKCLQKEPEKRFESADALAEDLLRFLKGESILAQPTTHLQRLLRWAQRNPLIASLLATVFSLLLILAVGAAVGAIKLAADRAQIADAYREAKHRETEAIKAKSHALQLAQNERNLRARIQDQLVRRTVADGVAALDNGDGLGSLAWFAKALEQSKGNSVLEEKQRIRLTTILHQSPKLINYWGNAAAALFSRDGRRVLIVNSEKDPKKQYARIWDAVKGLPLSPPLQHKDLALYYAAFSPDGRFVVTFAANVNENKNDQAWKSPWPLWTNSSNQTISKNTENLMFDLKKQVVGVWDAMSGKLVLGPLEQHSARGSGFDRDISLSRFGQLLYPRIYAVFSPNSRYLAIVGDKLVDIAGQTPQIPVSRLQRRIDIWDLTTGRRVIGPLKMPASLIFSPNSRYLVIIAHTSIGLQDQLRIKIWDLANGNLIVRLRLRKDDSFGFVATFSPDSRYLATRWGNAAQLWEVSTGRAVARPIALGYGTDVAISPDNRFLLGTDVSVPRKQPLFGDFGRFRALEDSAPYGDDLYFSGELVELSTGQRHELDFHLKDAALRRRNNLFDFKASFSTDGHRLLITGGETVHLWGLPRGKPFVPTVYYLGGNSGEISPSRPSPFRPKSSNKKMRNETKPISRGPYLLLSKKNDIQDAVLSPDGRLVAIVTGNFKTKRWEAQIWDAQTGSPLTSVLHHSSPLQSAVFSPSGRLVLTYGLQARVWEVATGKPVTPYLPHRGRIGNAAFTPDDRYVILASAVGTVDGEVRVWDMATLSPTPQSLQHYGEAWRTRFTSDGRRIVTSSDREELRNNKNRPCLVTVLDRTKRNVIKSLSLRGNSVFPAAISPDGRCIALSSSDHKSEKTSVRIWQLTKGKPVTAPLPHPKRVCRAAFSPDRKHLMTVTSDKYDRPGQVRLWDVTTSKLLPMPARLRLAKVADAALSFDGHRLAIISGKKAESKKIWIWNRKTGATTELPLHPDDGIERVLFGPHGRYLFAYGAAGRIWDTTKNKPVGSSIRHEHLIIETAVFSPDGSRLITTASAGAGVVAVIRLWNVADGQPICPPHNLGKIGTRIVFRSDSRYFLSISNPTGYSWKTRNGQIRLWDSATGWPLTPPLRHEYYVADAAFSRDGQHIFTISCKIREMLLRKWSLHSANLKTVDWQLLAQLLSGRRIDSSGYEKIVDPETIRRTWQELGPKYPHLFEVSATIAENWKERQTKKVIEWHRGEFRASVQSGLRSAVEFHNCRLNKLVPPRFDIFSSELQLIVDGFGAQAVLPIAGPLGKMTQFKHARRFPQNHGPHDSRRQTSHIPK